MKNRTMTCVLLSEEDYKQDNNIKGSVDPYDYHKNSVKIISDGIKTYCEMEMLIDSIKEHLEDKTLTFSKSEKLFNLDGTKNGIKYTFVDKANKLNIIILASQEIKNMAYDPYSKYDFVSSTVSSLNKLNKSTNKLRNVRFKKRVVAGGLCALTFVGSYVGTTKIINKISEKEEAATSVDYTDYDRYYRGIVDESNYNENADNLQEIANKVLKK